MVACEWHLDCGGHWRFSDCGASAEQSCRQGRELTQGKAARAAGGKAGAMAANSVRTRMTPS